MQPFLTHQGRAAVLDWTDVNTDLIIPARYLKRIERTGYGPLLFADKRYQPGEAPPPDDPDRAGAWNPEFPLNRPECQGCDVLIVGRNFGCGSSREHAVWAVAQAGWKVVIAPGKGEGFADIFEGNALNNGLLAIELDDADWRRILEAARTPQGAEVAVDLREQTVSLIQDGATSGPFRFEISETIKHRLLNGLDFIGETLTHEPAIAAYERSASAWSMLRA